MTLKMSICEKTYKKKKEENPSQSYKHLIEEA